MGNFRWMRRALDKEFTEAPQYAIELGSGDGSLGKALANSSAPLELTGLDLVPRPADWPEDWQWQQGDLFETLPKRSEPLVIANLILHHFKDPQLKALGGLLADRKLLIFSEPARAAAHHLQGFALRALKINRVTRHDLHVSIRAGFRRGELPALLGLDQKRWEVHEHHHFMGALRLIARRR